ncbi:hypothetical protein [Streptomyces sp. NPDC056452]
MVHWTRVEWHHFADEYPQFAGREQEFTARLQTARAPTSADDPAPGADGN